MPVMQVLHGSDHDVFWLQRDFGLYVVNMFDTGQVCECVHCFMPFWWMC